MFVIELREGGVEFCKMETVAAVDNPKVSLASKSK
jgi:hypothetical protein